MLYDICHVKNIWLKFLDDSKEILKREDQTGDSKNLCKGCDHSADFTRDKATSKPPAGGYTPTLEEKNMNIYRCFMSLLCPVCCLSISFVRNELFKLILTAVAAVQRRQK